jgi:hypothetical protein
LEVTGQGRQEVKNLTPFWVPYQMKIAEKKWMLIPPTATETRF